VDTVVDRPTPQQRVDVMGCDTFFLRRGRGESVLYLHGDRGGSEWIGALDQLSARFDVIAPDHPGMGHSSLPDWLDNIHDVAYFYLQFLKKLDLRDVHVIGSSLGGWIALEMAVRSTERLKSLTLIDSTGIYVNGQPPLPDQFLMTNEELVRTLFQDQSRAEVILQAPMSDDATDRFLRNRHMSAKLGWAPRFHDPNLEKWLPTIDIPTQILWGRHDVLFPVVYGERLASLIPGSDFVVFENSGHLPHVEEADKFTATVENFIRRIAS
jgi:pimeloyl-ACP methyl ester carboxylesterase